MSMMMPSSGLSIYSTKRVVFWGSKVPDKNNSSWAHSQFAPSLQSGVLKLSQTKWPLSGLEVALSRVVSSFLEPSGV